jgi:hypothetical protein
MQLQTNTISDVLYQPSLVRSKRNFCFCTNLTELPEYFSGNMSGNLRTITYFDYAALKRATRDFHQKNQLGRGGFGPVYLVKENYA